MRSPRYAEIEVTLAALKSVWGDPRILLWQVQSHELQFVVALQSRQCDFVATLAMWQKYWRRIEHGEVVRDGDAVYHPLRTATGQLVGFVQASDGQQLDREHGPVTSEYVTWLLTRLASTLTTPAIEPDAKAGDVVAASVAARPKALAPAVVVSATADGDEVERTKLLAVLEANEWNAAAAADVMGVSRQTVWRRRKRLQIERPELSPYDSRGRRTTPEPT